MQDFAKQLEQAAAQGWDGLDGIADELRQARDAQGLEEREEARRQAHIFAACFESEAGRACLQLLREKTILLPPTPEELSADKVEAFALLHARRMGEAQVIHTIESALAFARDSTQEDL